MLPVVVCELSLGSFSSTCVFNVADIFDKLRPGVQKLPAQGHRANMFI